MSDIVPKTKTSEPPAMTTPQAVASLDTFALDTKRILNRKRALQDVMKQVMIEHEHYGVIPGCGNKPTLLKPGAEAIASLFQLCPRYSITKTELPNGHREYEVVCDLLNPAGGFIGSGVGSATTMETKYRFRKAEQVCPKCGKTTIIKGKKQYGGGWICYKAKGGCGAKFKDGDPAIESQGTGRVEHDNPADHYNTVLKMGKKRAFIDAILTVTGASDIFTQDLEDLQDVTPSAEKHAPETPPAPANAADVSAEIAGITTPKALEAHWNRFAARYKTYPDYQTIADLYAKRMQELKRPQVPPQPVPPEPEPDVLPENELPPDFFAPQTPPEPEPVHEPSMSIEEQSARNQLAATAQEFPNEYQQALAELGIAQGAKPTFDQVKQVMARINAIVDGRVR